MIRRLSLLTIFLSTLAVGAAYASAFLPGGAPGWGAWLMVVGTSALMTATMALGAAKQDRLGRLWLPLAFVFLLFVGGFGAALLLPASDPAAPVLWLGLPPGAAVVLYGIGLLPLLVVPVAYALTFDEQTLSAADLEGIRTAARALHPRPGTVPGEPAPTASRTEVG